MPKKYSRRSTPTAMPGFAGGVAVATTGTHLEVRADVDIEISVRKQGTVESFTARVQATNGPVGGGPPTEADWMDIDEPILANTTYFAVGCRYKYWRVVLSTVSASAGTVNAVYTLYQE